MYNERVLDLTGGRGHARSFGGPDFEENLFQGAVVVAFASHVCKWLFLVDVVLHDSHWRCIFAAAAPVTNLQSYIQPPRAAAADFYVLHDCRLESACLCPHLVFARRQILRRLLPGLVGLQLNGTTRAKVRNRGGIVTDSSGAVVPNAKITFHQEKIYKVLTKCQCLPFHISLDFA
jgi:hypothetical protein